MKGSLRLLGLLVIIGQPMKWSRQSIHKQAVVENERYGLLLRTVGTVIFLYVNTSIYVSNMISGLNSSLMLSSDLRAMQ